MAETAVIDALELADRLEKAGMEHGNGAGAAAAIRDTLREDYATKSDLRGLEARIDGRFSALHSELR